MSTLIAGLEKVICLLRFIRCNINN